MSSLVGIVAAARITLLVASSLTLIGCVLRDVGYRRADNVIDEGKTEQEVIAAVGAPGRTTDASRPCVERGGVRELHYDAVTYVGSVKAGEQRGVVACLDQNRTVVAKLFIEY